jgi:hypothetical protein
MNILAILNGENPPFPFETKRLYFTILVKRCLENDIWEELHKI